MSKRLFFFTVMLSIVGMTSCTNNHENDRALIEETEREFALMADREGVAEAFYHYAADSAVIMRGGKLFRGKEAIREYYRNNLKHGTRLLWSPDFVDVSGDLGYTYGKYILMVTDSTGAITESRGYFHTVWKRQADGSWRFVWD